ncbi:uncharacterized protein [Palaemon carinicauda]|uniref:uncharacterized protein n=1 Tax=Palaemon carinicauda TaxID=392227 RepID=UPI0035B602E4
MDQTVFEEKLCETQESKSENAVLQPTAKHPANDVFKFVASLEVFDIVKAVHEGIGHSGVKKTIAERSDNGREYVNAVIAEHSTLWPELSLVTGRPRHPQSQGAVARLNGVIQDKLAIWMQEYNSKNWSVDLKFVQWQINISRHETRGHSPFKVTFGQEPQVGLGSSVLPRSPLNEIATEEDLETFVENEEGDEDAVTGITAQVERDEDAVTGATAEVERATAEVESDEDAVIGATAETQSGCFQEIQDAADAGQSKAAVRMTRRGNQLVRQLEAGQCATLRVPDVDRGPADPKNLLVVVMKEEDGLYTVDCREGVLGSKNTTADLSPTDQALIKADDVPDIRLTLRTATAKGTGGKGCVKFQCRTQCSSGRCSCRKKEMKCNSRCHQRRECKN